MKIDICVTFYNQEKKLILKCLNSVKEQSNNSFSCLVIDDSSNLDISKYIEKLCLKYNFYYYRNEKNIGVCKSRNILIEKSNSNFFVFLDGDDYILPNFIENIINIKKLETYDIIFYWMRDNDNKILKFSNRKNILLMKSTAACEKVYRTEFIKKNHIFFIDGPHKSEDLYFSYLSYFYSINHFLIKNNLYHYNKNKTYSPSNQDYDFYHSSTNYYFNNFLKKIEYNLSSEEYWYIYTTNFYFILKYIKKNKKEMLILKEFPFTLKIIKYGIKIFIKSVNIWIYSKFF